MQKTLDEMQKELNEDIKISLIGLSTQIANNPYLYQKWLNYYNQAKIQLKSLENKKSKVLKERLDFYTGRADEPCLTMYEKSELKIVIAADDELQKADSQLFVLNLKLDFIKEALEAIKQRSFAMKHILDNLKFENGEY